MNDTAPSRYWTRETDDRNILWLGLETEGSMNVLSRGVIEELDDVLSDLDATPPAGVVVYSRKSSGFIAGADVNEFPDLAAAPDLEHKILEGHAVLNKLEALPCPTVAVLNGTALGGGLELALACDWRIAFETEQKTLGLPEVRIGVHPGLGGTVRCPQLCGVRSAMELMLSGKPVSPTKARSIGLVDALTSEAAWRADAARYATRRPESRSVPLPDRLLSLGFVRPILASVLRKQVRPKANPRHYPAPYAMIDLWEKHGASRDGLEAEARSFAALVKSETAQNLVRVFFLQDRLKDLAKVSDRTFSHVHVVGAGTMGADIAAWCALRGLSVTLQDREQQYVDSGLEKARKTLKRKLKKDERVEEAMSRLVDDHTGEGARTADLIVEAIFEDLEAKRSLFVDLESRARPDAVLASNTSSIPLDQIAEPLQDPARLIGLHFFNPVALMPLVEVVSSPLTRAAETDAGTAFVKHIGKLPLPCKALPGFLVNRILAPYMDEAFRMYEEGMQPEAIDRLATDFGMPVGPLELADSVGIDILLHVSEIVGPTIGRELPATLRTFVEEKRLGEKSGQGFYRWEDGKAQKASVKAPAERGLQDRLILPFVNEAVACVADAVVADAELADAGTIFGAGFAPFRGGPLHYARNRGIDSILASMQALEKQHGQRFAPSEGWQLLRQEQRHAS